MRAPIRRSRLALTIVAAFWLAPGLAAELTRTASDHGETAAGLDVSGGNDQHRRRRGRHRGGFSGGHAAPEIDPGLFAGGAALLIGGTLVLLGQRRKRRPSATSGGTGR